MENKVKFTIMVKRDYSDLVKMLPVIHTLFPRKEEVSDPDGDGVITITQKRIGLNWTGLGFTPKFCVDFIQHDDHIEWVQHEHHEDCNVCIGGTAYPFEQGIMKFNVECHIKDDAIPSMYQGFASELAQKKIIGDMLRYTMLKIEAYELTQ